MCVTRLIWFEAYLKLKWRDCTVKIKSKSETGCLADRNCSFYPPTMPSFEGTLWVISIPANQVGFQTLSRLSVFSRGQSRPPLDSWFSNNLPFDHSFEEGGRPFLVNLPLVASHQQNKKKISGSFLKSKATFWVIFHIMSAGFTHTEKTTFDFKNEAA